MQIQVKTSDVLQSVGFALTNAEEVYTNLRHNLTGALVAAIGDGQVLSAEAQKDAHKQIVEAHNAMTDLKRIKFMAEYTKQEEVTLDLRSFELLEANLPMRD